MYVVGGHGYVGSRTVAFADKQGVKAIVVSRQGDTRHGVPSLAWPDFLIDMSTRANQRTSIVWILDGAKHSELDRLKDLLDVADESTHVAAVSSCTVYGNQLGQVCDEAVPLSLVTANAKLKAACEATLEASSVSYGALRLGALYGVDDHGVRRDRVEKWVTEAARDGKVTVPEPSHWRGWLHRDQAARALFRTANERVEGIYNVTSSNYRFGEAAAIAADHFGAAVVSDGKDDPMDYQIDSTKAIQRSLLDRLEGEDLPSSVASFAKRYASQ